jgi:hypothetical protein
MRRCTDRGLYAWMLSIDRTEYKLVDFVMFVVVGIRNLADETELPLLSVLFSGRCSSPYSSSCASRVPGESRDLPCQANRIAGLEAQPYARLCYLSRTSRPEQRR